MRVDSKDPTGGSRLQRVVASSTAKLQQKMGVKGKARRKAVQGLPGLQKRGVSGCG